MIMDFFIRLITGFFHLITGFFDFFVWHPERAGFIALVFLTAALLIVILQWRMKGRIHSWPCLAASISWALYAAWEWYATIKRWNIRVDLFMLFPALLVVSAWAVILSYRWKSPPQDAP